MLLHVSAGAKLTVGAVGTKYPLYYSLNIFSLYPGCECQPRCGCECKPLSHFVPLNPAAGEHHYKSWLQPQRPHPFRLVSLENIFVRSVAARRVCTMQRSNGDPSGFSDSGRLTRRPNFAFTLTATPGVPSKCRTHTKKESSEGQRVFTRIHAP